MSTTFVGYGVALSFPTATDATLDSRKWSAGPGIILAHTAPKATYGFLAQQLWSYAGASDRSSVNTTTIQPFVTFLLSKGRQVNFTSQSS